MKLSHYVAKKFEEELERLFKKEKAESGFMKQEDYDSCRDRAMDWLETAFYGVVDQAANDVGLSIAVHREEEHGEDTTQEQAELLNDGAEPEMSTQSWWNH